MCETGALGAGQVIAMFAAPAAMLMSVQQEDDLPEMASSPCCRGEAVARSDDADAARLKGTSMKRTRLRITVVVLGAMALPLIGCSSSKTIVKKPAPLPPDQHVVVSQPSGPPPHAPAHGHRRKHQFMYYPGANVYFDTESNRYFWVEGGQWVIGVKLPRRIVLHAGSAEAIMLDPHQPYAEHDAAAMSAHAELKHPHGKAVGHDKAHGKSVGHRKQTAAAPGDSN